MKWEWECPKLQSLNKSAVLLVYECDHKLLKILTKRSKDSNTQESPANINNSSAHCVKRHHCCFNNEKDVAHHRNNGGEVGFCECGLTAFYYTIKHCHMICWKKNHNATDIP